MVGGRAKVAIFQTFPPAVGESAALLSDKRKRRRGLQSPIVETSGVRPLDALLLFQTASSSVWV
jgi:hypothetical protein